MIRIPENENMTLIGQSFTNDFLIIGYISLVTTSLSILGSLSIIIAVIYRRACFQPVIFQILNISLADFLASLFVLCSVMEFMLLDTKSTVYCLFMGTLSYIFYSCSFIFLILYAAQALAAVHRKRKGKTWRLLDTKFRLNLFNIIYIFAWLVPLCIGAPIYISLYKEKNISDCFNCLPQVHFKNGNDCKMFNNKIFVIANRNRFIFLSSEIITLILIVSLLTLSLVQYFKYITTRGIFGGAEQIHWKKRKHRVYYFVFSFIFCWICSILLQIFLACEVLDPQTLNPIYIIESLTNPLHGFVNAIVYGWQRRAFTNIFRKPGSFDLTGQATYESCTRRPTFNSSSDDNLNITRSDNLGIYADDDSLVVKKSLNT